MKKGIVLLFILAMVMIQTAHADEPIKVVEVIPFVYSKTVQSTERQNHEGAATGATAGAVLGWVFLGPLEAVIGAGVGGAVGDQADQVSVERQIRVTGFKIKLSNGQTMFTPLHYDVGVIDLQTAVYDKIE